jgi:hypothetical protein
MPPGASYRMSMRGLFHGRGSATIDDRPWGIPPISGQTNRSRMARLTASLTLWTCSFP